MRIVCPACEATYEVPDRLIGSGRNLRCKACGHHWHVAPPAPEAAPEDAQTAAPAREPPGREPLGPVADQPPAAPPEPPPVGTPAAPGQGALPAAGPPALLLALRSGLVLQAAWAVSLLVVGITLLALWQYRAEIAEAWPPATRLFHLVGGVAQG